MSNQETNISGLSNSIVNTGTVSGSITNSVNLTGLSATDKEKAELTTLLQQLETEIKKLPANRQEEASLLMKRLSLISEELQGQKPDKEAVQFGLESLKKAAENIVAIAPTIMPLSVEIAKKVCSII